MVKNPPANVRDSSSIPGLGRSPEEGNDHPLQYSCLGNPMDRGVWWAKVHAVAKSRTRLKRLIRHAAFTEEARILKLKQTNKQNPKESDQGLHSRSFPLPLTRKHPMGLMSHHRKSWSNSAGHTWGHLFLYSSTGDLRGNPHDEGEEGF